MRRISRAEKLTRLGAEPMLVGAAAREATSQEKGMSTMKGLKLQRLRIRSSRQRGFTLVELIIVAALISILSGLAVFAVQQTFQSSVRKAAIGEARNIATALEFANIDTGIFPKIAFLDQSEASLIAISRRLGGGDNGIFAQMDILSRPVGANATLPGAIRSNWRGPYFAQSPTRGGIAQGRGGFAFMYFPTLPPVADNSVTSSFEGGFRWPMDPFNNPYVVYMLDLITPEGGGTPFLRFANGDPALFPNDFPDQTRKGNFVNAVVSYGPNNIPGGTVDGIRPDFGPIPDGPGAIFAPGQGIWALRLFKGPVNFSAGKGVVTHGYLLPNEFTRERAEIWNRQFHGNIDLIGITDPGSDDIVFEF